ncbi:MAG: WG repeat-containing protein [Rikenellaceae bacterium]
MFALIGDILEAVREPNSFRTLQDLEFVRLPNGALNYSTGNNAVVFSIRIDGHKYAMRCYRRTKPYLRELYGEMYLPEELNVGGFFHPKYIDVVLCDWVEGRSLAQVVEGCNRDEIRELANSFDRLALSLIDADWAHGDLSPDNIIVDEDGELHLIDLDARYTPELEGCESSELGTRAYQSKLRTSHDFHARIDDFSIVIISTSLHALSIDPNLRDEFPFLDGLLINGERVEDERYEVMNQVLELFARSGYFAQYRALKSLRFNRLVIDILPDLLRTNNLITSDLELFISWGICGYCDSASGEVIIPPLFDEAFEFRGDYALVKVQRWWFYIDKSGRAIESCGEWQDGKPSKKRPQY